MRRHDTDITSLVFGLVFIGLATLWALSHGGVLGSTSVKVLGPAVLVAAGVIGLVATVRGSVRRSTARPPQATQPSPEGENPQTP